MDLTGPKLIGWTEVDLIGPNGVEVDLIGPHRNNLILERTNYLQQILEKKKHYIMIQIIIYSHISRGSATGSNKR